MLVYISIKIHLFGIRSGTPQFLYKRNSCLNRPCKHNRRVIGFVHLAVEICLCVAVIISTRVYIERVRRMVRAVICQKQISVEGNGQCCHRPSSNWETNQPRRMVQDDGGNKTEGSDISINIYHIFRKSSRCNQGQGYRKISK